MSDQAKGVPLLDLRRIDESLANQMREAFDRVRRELTERFGGVTAFVGRNGQGKTNLVEAVDYIARLSSHRVSSDAPLVRHGADQAVVAQQQNH